MWVVGLWQPFTGVAAGAFHQEKLEEMGAAITEAISQEKCPGGVLWVEHDATAHVRTFGDRAVVPALEKMTVDTIFDAASLTKVVACTPAVMLLVERGKVDLDEPVMSYVPEFGANGKEKVTVRHLMTHTSGLRPGIETRSGWSGQSGAIEKACAEKPQTEPGKIIRYSDINFFVLGEIVQRVAGKPLQEFVLREIYEPLRMTDTQYLPPNSKSMRVAPTEVLEGKALRGIVHDPTARRMGGVAGHAGLFTTAADLARYARMLLNEGELDGVRLFKRETVELMTSVQTPTGVVGRRGLGWDIDTGYSGPRGKLFPVGSYGHTGWTGTSLWIDPFSKTFVIFLSNRNHPNENGNVIGLRHVLGTLAAEAVADFNFAFVQGALAPKAYSVGPVRAPAKYKTLNGIDVLARRNFDLVKGLRLGLVTNQTGQDRARNSTIDILKGAPGVQLVALFSPEHGIRGELDEKVGDTVDEKTGLPVYSLYGDVRKPKADQLKGIDALVYDIQDVGCRFYTYTSTMGLAMEAAAENGKKFIVLDRVNPIDAMTIDGPVLADKPSFVGFHPVPLRYGMTIGELARMFNAERTNRADLVVVPLENWSRSLYLDETGLPWTNPSPNMRNLKQAILYPGVGLLEIAVSVGRGTDTPFEVVGAPYVNDVEFAEELNSAQLPGVKFVPIRFTPNTSVHKGTNCGGVYILLADRRACNVVDVGLLVAQTLARLYPTDFNMDRIKHLLLHPPTLAALKEQQPIPSIRSHWDPDIKSFRQRRAKYLLYK